MEVVSIEEGRYEQTENLPGSSTESDTSSHTSESNDSEHSADDFEKSDNGDLIEDLQKTIAQCYKADHNIASQSSSQNTNITNDEEFQTTALCQFMDILNDLDEVLDKSLLACLDDTKQFDSDEEDLICKIKNCIGSASGQSDRFDQVSVDDDNQVIYANQEAPTHSYANVPQNETEVIQLTSLGRSKSFTEVLNVPRQELSLLERASTTNDTIRNSMRRLDPIEMPPPQSCEALTLPVILFLEHHTDIRPTSAPIQLQVTAANLSADGASGPLIVGRRALLMNRTLSLPSPGESDITTVDWTGRNTARSIARSSASSSSSESLNGIVPASQNTLPASEARNEEQEDPPYGVWPHRMSSMLACLSCTVGLFNISRFAMFSVHFGASFIVQFFILSLLIGIPLFTLHLCLGQVLQAGPVDMWKISPIFQGVGLSLLLSQAVIGLYTIVPLSWMFVYFRDSFITSDDRYKWSLPHDFSFEPDGVPKNNSFKLEESIPQYFNIEVLQTNLDGSSQVGTIKFQVAFNLAVVWMIVYVGLSKGLHSYGKAVYLLIFLPICGTLVLCTKLLTLIPYDTVVNIFSETEWSEFFVNSNSWAAAAQEVFLTWGLLGPCVMQLTSHRSQKSKTNSVLQRESACVIAYTFAMLLLGSFLANTCVQVLKHYGYVYAQGSFETLKSSQFLFPLSGPAPAPARTLAHYASGVGLAAPRRAPSGWQPAPLPAHLVPAALAALPPAALSPAWAVIFYLTLILLGLGQQMAVWRCVVSGALALGGEALRPWESAATFLSCAGGLAIGLVLCTDAGIRIVHFIDYVWVGAWWQCALQAVACVGVFAVRGRPFSPDTVVAALYDSRGRASAALAALLSFVWTVVLPVLLCAICVMDFRIGQQRQLYSWRKPAGYFPVWARQVGVAMQQGAVLLLPVTAFIQTWRYMNKGPPDILDRIQNLYRPHMGAPPPAPARAAPEHEPAPDPPPKYTPPPSYSTATGARLLTSIRRSFRTLRRITSTSRTEPIEETLPTSVSEVVERDSNISQPPSYSGDLTLTVTDETDSRARPVSSTSRNSLLRCQHLTRDYLRRSFVRSDSIKNIRSSLRRSFKYGGGLTTSHEQLVRDVEPISNTVAMSTVGDAPASPQSRSLASII